MNATIGPAAIAERFRGAFLMEETGRLEVRSEGTTYSILFDRGMVAGARTDPAADGGPDPDATDEIVQRAFSCEPEGIEFVSSPLDVEDSKADILRTVEIFLAGVRSMTGFDTIREVLNSLDQRLVLRGNPAVPLERLTLKPIHGFVLSRLTANMSFREITATVGPEDDNEAARFIFALLLLGSVVLDPPFAHGLLRTELLLMDYRRDFAREEAESAFIRETYAAVQAQSPYKILGVHESAAAEDIRKAYDERKRALAPERFLERVREQMRSELSIIEARLAEVYLTLQSSHPDMSRLSSSPSSEETLDLDALSLRREVTKTEVAASLDEREKLAESYFQKAKQYYTHGDYYNCIQYCTQAIRHNEQGARFYFLLGEAQAHNPDRRWQKMAEQSFLQGIKLDPWNANYLVTLGQFYRKQGFGTRARRQFEKALQIQPNHPKAKEELESVR